MLHGCESFADGPLPGAAGAIGIRSLHAGIGVRGERRTFERRLRQIYGAPSAVSPICVNAVYARPLESLEADWLRFCDAWAG